MKGLCYLLYGDFIFNQINIIMSKFQNMPTICV